MSVDTASGARVSPADLQRSQATGLLDVDTTHPACAGRPVVLTAAVRVALTGRCPQQVREQTPLPRPGTRPASPKPRH
ncbi:hypothetical protein J8N05_45680 [Streptomyces sp. BH-SS-21]|uniref:Uncharacterized protein n=1 Tax=Streptomyces liliiviolaceus TaxID=2823109 RepID=A0A941BEP8_9ACTN|nr:hypothetical protein [Streptomyces liliiviolaceus]MBQ0855463.1 hypothetical protein [Streptomyces liliiviolaceus]